MKFFQLAIDLFVGWFFVLLSLKCIEAKVDIRLTAILIVLASVICVRAGVLSYKVLDIEK